MNRTIYTLFVLCLVMTLSACSSDAGGGSGGEDAGTGDGNATDGATTEGGTTDGATTEGGTTEAGTTEGGTTGEPEPEPEPEWTLDTSVPSVVGGKTMAVFGGYADAEGARLYFCGDGGIVRIRKEEGWVNQDVSTSMNLNDCHIVNDGLMAAVGDTGEVWKLGGSENWQSADLIELSPNLRAVWVTGLATLHVAGVQGVIFRLDTNTWTDERIEGVTSTIEDIHGLSDEELYAVGDNVLLRYDGTVWTSEAVPEDELGTPVANQGFRAKGVWAADSAHVWAVGDKGKIAFRDEAGVWSYQDSQWYGGTPFQAVWGFGPDHVYTLGTVGKVRRWNGSEWTVVEVKTPKKTSLGDKWPAEQVVPPEGPGLNYVGAFGLDSENLWFFDGGGLLLQYNDDYQL